MKALDYLLSQPLLATPEAAEAARRIVEREPISADSPEDESTEPRVVIHAVAAKPGKPVDGAMGEMTIRDGVACIPVLGPIFRYADWFTELCGGVTVDGIAKDFTAAMNNPNVSSILLEIDSPGGQASGIGELADMIALGAKTKDVCAFIGHEGCSAAYWIAAACPMIVMAPAAFAGSIGVVMGYPKPDPKSRSVEFVASQSPRKRPDISTEGGKAVVQQRVDDLAEVFIQAVATLRNVTPEKVMSDFGQGGVLIASKAVAVGMANKMGSYESTLSEMAAKARSGQAPKFRPQAAAVAKAVTPRRTPMGLQEKVMKFFTGASADANEALTDDEKVKVFHAVAKADNDKSADLPAATTLLVGEALELPKFEDSPIFKAQAEKIAAMEQMLADQKSTKLTSDAAAFAKGLAMPSVAKIAPAQIDAVASLYGRVAKADTDGTFLAEFCSVMNATPTAADKFGAAVYGKDIHIMESVARSSNPSEAVDPNTVKSLMKMAGISDN